MKSIINCLVLFLFLGSCPQLAGQGNEHLFIAHGFKNYEGVKKFFEGSSRKNIGELRYHSDLKISCYAAWLWSCLQCQDLKAKEIDQSEDIKKEFLIFLSGRLNSPIPNWWANDLLERGPQKTWPEKFSYDGPVNHPIGLTVNELTDTKIDLELGTKKFEMKWDQKDYWGQGEFELEDLRCISLHSLSVDKFICAISDDRRVLVFCVSKKHGVIWKNLVESLAQRSLQGDLRDGTIVNEVVVSNGIVNVFSSNFNSLGSFDLATGSDILAFTTWLSDKSTGKKAKSRIED